MTSGDENQCWKSHPDFIFQKSENILGEENIWKTKKNTNIHLHCKHAKLAQHHFNCRDNVKAVLTWFAKERHNLANAYRLGMYNRGLQSTLTILSCVKCPVIHSLLFNSAGWEWKILSHTQECTGKCTEHCIESRGCGGKLKSKRGRIYPLNSSIWWIINK